MFINRKWKWCGQFGWVVEIWIRHMKWANNKWEAKSQGFCAEQTFYSDHNNGDKIIWLYTKTKLVRSGYARYTSTDTTCVHETDLSNFIKSFITKQRRQIKQQLFFLVCSNFINVTVYAARVCVLLQRLYYFCHPNRLKSSAKKKLKFIHPIQFSHKSIQFFFHLRLVNSWWIFFNAFFFVFGPFLRTFLFQPKWFFPFTNERLLIVYILFIFAFTITEQINRKW